jgi:TRAP-type C4-dicarboxylate transport system substrate-binding protein
VNLKTWNKLTASQQEALTKAFQKGVEAVAPLDYPMIKAGYDLVKERGDEITNLVSAEELKPWFDAAKPVIDDWIKEIDAQGYDGAAIYNALKAAIAKYQ